MLIFSFNVRELSGGSIKKRKMKDIIYLILGTLLKFKRPNFTRSLTLLSIPYGGIPSLNKALDPMLVIVCYYFNMVLFERNAPFSLLGIGFIMSVYSGSICTTLCFVVNLY